MSSVNEAVVSDIMTKNVIHSVRPSDAVKKAAQRMKEVGSGCLLVIDRGMLVGIMTERDIVRRIVAEGKSSKTTLVSEIMSKPVVTSSPKTPVSEAAKIMIKYRIRRLPITRGRRVVGILTTTDYAKYLGNMIRNPLLTAAAREEYQTIFE